MRVRRESPRGPASARPGKPSVLFDPIIAMRCGHATPRLARANHQTDHQEFSLSLVRCESSLFALARSSADVGRSDAIARSALGRYDPVVTPGL